MESSLSIQTIIITLVSLVIAITIHETMHAYVALRLGDTTAQEGGRISLNPLNHIDPFATVILPLVTLVLFHVPLLAAKPVPFNPNRVKYNEFGAALISLAGPLSNLILAVLGALCLHVLPGNSITLGNAVSIFVIINVGIFVFNMVPIPPLDGSRVLYAFAPEPLQDIMARIEPFGFFVVFGLILAVPGFSNLLIHINNSILQILP